MQKYEPAISFILFNPTVHTWERLALAIDAGYDIFLFDNSPSCTDESFLAKNQRKIRYFTTGANNGIAYALKILSNAAWTGGWQMMLYFDQDTIFTLETLLYVSEFAMYCNTNWTTFDTLRVFSVTFRAKKMNSKQNRVISFGNYNLEEVEFTISSGTLFFLDKLAKVGGHDVSYFIDGVDYYICLAAEKQNQLIAEISNIPGLDHSTEQGDHCWSFLGKQFIGRKYPISRIKDFLRASFKLLFFSLRIGSSKTLKLIKLFFSYILIQIVVRFSIRTE